MEKTLHSNLLAACFMFPMAVAGHEVIPFIDHMTNAPFEFKLIYTLSCVLAAGIGASIFWLVQQTSGSTLSFAGACNKIPVVILGAILFNTHISPEGWLSVFFGIFAGVIFAVAKARQKDKTQTSGSAPSVPARLKSREQISPDTKILIRNDSQDETDDSYVESADDSPHAQSSS